MNDLIVANKSGLLSTSDNEIKIRLRIWVRKLFESDEEIRKVVINSVPAKSAKEPLTTLILDKVTEEARSSLSDILDELLNELEYQRTHSPSLYLIDSSTGKMVMRAGENTVYQPPDYIGEDGIKRRARPALHPGISVPLTMAAHESGKLQKALAKPGSAKSLQYATQPDSIMQIATEKLRSLGCEVDCVLDGKIEEIEIGREYYDPLQSSNSSFHRHVLFGSILAKRIAESIKPLATRCEIISVKLEQNSKQRWYKAVYKY